MTLPVFQSTSHETHTPNNLRGGGPNMSLPNLRSVAQGLQAPTNDRDDSIRSGVTRQTLTPHVPPRAVAYQRTGYALGLFGVIWHITGLWLLLRTGLSTRLRTAAYRFSRRPIPRIDGTPPFLALTVYFLGFSLLIVIWSLPLSLAGLGLESHYGFSRQTAAGYLSDVGIGFLFNCTVIPVLWCAYRLRAASPRHWWVWLWAILAPLLFVQMVLQPLVIAPAYNRFTPLPDGALRARILALAERAGIRGGRVLVADTSRRTRHVNAFVTGWGPTTRIVIEDTALKELPEDQILAMVGHEMGHYVEGHVWILFVSSAVGAGFLLWILARMIPWLLHRFGSRYGLTGLTDLAALPLILLALYILLQLQMPAANAESRLLEHRADTYGLRLTHLNAAMADLFVGFAERDYADPDPPALFQWWYGSHPSLSSRIEYARHYRTVAGSSD